MECPNRVLSEVLHALQGNLDVAIRSGAIVWPILMTFQLFGKRKREREREQSIRLEKAHVQHISTLSSSLRLVTMTMVGQSNSQTILQKSGKVDGWGP